MLERVTVQNVGDLDAPVRGSMGLLLVVLASRTPRSVRWPVRVLGASAALTGITGWCPGYSAAGCRRSKARRSSGRIGAPRVDRQHAGADAMRATNRFDALANARHGDPFSILGPHDEAGSLIVRAYQPAAERVAIVRTRRRGR